MERKIGVMLSLLLVAMALTFNIANVRTVGTGKVRSPVASPETAVYVDPSEIINTALVPCTNTTVSIKIRDVVGLYGLDVKLSWNPAILECVGRVVMIPVEDHPGGVLHKPVIKVKDWVDNIAGTYQAVYSSMLPAPTFNGTGTIVALSLHVKGRGECALEIVVSDISDKGGFPIAHEVENGYFRNVPVDRLPVADFTWSPIVPVANETVVFDASNSKPSGYIANYTWNFGDGNTTTVVSPVITHVYKIDGTYTVTLTIADIEGVVGMNMTKSLEVMIDIRFDVAVVDVKPWSDRVVVNGTVNIDVTLRNNGSRIETFNVTAYYDGNVIKKEEVVDLFPFTNRTLIFTWNTTNVAPGNYIISAEASQVPGETNTANNIYIDDTIKVVIPNHDVAVISVIPSKTIVGTGYSMSVNATVENQGDYTENFDVTFYANETIIETKTITLPSQSSAAIIFTWNTTGFAKGNYTIKVKATPVPDETDLTDNEKIDGIVTITIPGDVDGNFWVNIYDVVRICAAYDSVPPGPPYEPNYDINCDGKIDIYDVVIACSHYDEKDP